MANAKSPHPVYDKLLQMLKSSNEEKVAQATDVFVRIGTLAAETLLEEACNKRLKLCNRIRLLQVVKKIGVRLDVPTCRQLQTLIEDQSRDVRLEAGEILVDASPSGVLAIAKLPFMTGRPYRFPKRRRPGKLGRMLKGKMAESEKWHPLQR